VLSWLLSFLAQWGLVLLLIGLWAGICLKLGEMAENTGSEVVSAAGWVVFVGGLVILGWWVWRSFFG